MVALLTGKRVGPIGIDLGSRSVKLVQLTADQSRLVDAARWDLPSDPDTTPQQRASQWTQAIRQAHEGRRFRGRDAVLCLGHRELFVQNIRIPKPTTDHVDPIVRREAADRIPFPIDDTEIRYLEAADVRQGDSMRREVIVLACHRPVLEQTLEIVKDAGLRPVAVDVEPLALLRCYAAQFRREVDQDRRAVFVHIGHSNTVVVIAQGADVLFVKYIELGGQHFDQAVARHLQMELPDAWALRRHNGDRRVDQQDPEVARSVAESCRPVVDRLANEVSLCIRYHSVTFRGQPLVRMVLGGGEATSSLVERLAARLDLQCELGDPLRCYDQAPATGHKGQWDVALGLALRETKPS